MPDKVKELAAKWEQWAERVHVYPRGGAGAKTPTPGAYSAAEPKALPNPPQVAGIGFTVTATIRGPKPKGVALAHGGVRFGYSLHFRDGRPVFSVRNEGKLTELEAKEPVSGKVTVAATLSDRTMTISVDGKEVASRESPGLITEQPGLGLYEGLDFRDPVGSYQVPNSFVGKILDHHVDVAIPKVAMRTPWGEKVTAENAWREYPRPQMRRDQWTNLNGKWNYAVTSKETKNAPKQWDGEILVPFAIEAPLSGVEKRITPDEALWYRRSFTVEKNEGKRTLLNFEAVDYQSTVWVNGKQVGEHVGGNLPFSFDITEALNSGENEITVRVTDATDAPGTYQLRGKQTLNPGGIWYTPVSGIWQTVWMEEVPVNRIDQIVIDSRIDGSVDIRVDCVHAPQREVPEITISLDGKELSLASASDSDSGFHVTIPDPQLWSPNSPTLYEVEIKYGEDIVHSYFGIRETGVEKDADGNLRLTLNGKPIFHWGTLDQGWWPDGLLTPPSDDAMKSDIEFLKAAGFNTIRKHIKVEPRRYYYHCDQLGMMVWQDQVSSGSGKKRETVDSSPEWTRLKPDPTDATWPDAAHDQYMTELAIMMKTLHDHPCIVQWVPFNEAWGQHRSLAVGEWTMKNDPSRQVNIASGGNWFPTGHIVDHHQYPHPGFPFELGEDGRFDGFVNVVGEFGGHGFPVEGHLWSKTARNWGYGGLPKDKAEWLDRYRTSIEILAELKKQGIAAGIYTQTTDVEGEINGLITYDRQVQKIAPKDLKEIAKILFE
ncbi:MAG: beta galactosidase jelly roll domain-containing protein [Verrucomicrobiae bacterium]|nr:beta galactosidase jelly roll domain-containing protein [Verrucomicrobiae bacterium]